jgi:hypothetical protein
MNQLFDFIGPCPTDLKRRSLYLSAHTSEAWLYCCGFVFGKSEATYHAFPEHFGDGLVAGVCQTLMPASN